MALLIKNLKPPSSLRRKKRNKLREKRRKSKHQRKRKVKVRRNQLIRKEEKLNLQSSRAHQNLNGSTLAILELAKLLSARPMNHLRSSTSKRSTLEKVNSERLDLV